MKLGYSLLAAYELKLYFPKYKDTSIGIEDLYKAQKSYEPNPPTCTYIIIQKKKNQNCTQNSQYLLYCFKLP